MKKQFIGSYSLTAFTKFGTLGVALFSILMFKMHLADPGLYHFFGLGPLIWGFASLFWGNLYYSFLKRKIIVTSDGLINIEAPVYFLGRNKKKIPEEIKWSDIKELRKKNDLLYRGLRTYYSVITHDGKEMFFTSSHYPKVKDLIAYIEFSTGKNFVFANDLRAIATKV